MSELIETLVRAFITLFGLIVEAAIHLISGSITVVAWCCSKTFRQRKRVEWQDKKIRQFVELGWSGFCLTALVAIPIWLSWPKSESNKGGDVIYEFGRGEAGEDFRVRLRTTNTSATGPGTNLLIVVGEGGTARIMGTKTLDELKQQIQTSVKAFAEKPNGPTNSGRVHKPSDRGTGR